MIRKLALICLGASILSTPAFAARKYGMAGCGLGSAVFGTGGIQTSAATTNGSFYSQLFGISFGTSNCKPDKDTAAVLQQEAFVSTNYSSLAKEMAQGKGETLTAFAETLGCPNTSQARFNLFVQNNYQTIIAAPGSMAMLDTVKAQLEHDSELANACAFSTIY